MKVVILREDTGFAVGDAEPVCSYDFCDACGDCLVCFSGSCYSGGYARGDHVWVVESDKVNDWITRHHEVKL